MSKTKILIHLVNEKVIEIQEDWFLKDEILKTMNDGNCNFQIKNYIIPKSSINYIKFEEAEGEMKND